MRIKNAVIYGAGGVIGGAVARAFASQGANVFLAGRTLAKLEAVAKDIVASGGMAETAQVDALDEQSVEKHADSVAAKVGGIDITLNAVVIFHVQGTPFAELSLEDYSYPVVASCSKHPRLYAKSAFRRHSAFAWGSVGLRLDPEQEFDGADLSIHKISATAERETSW